MSHLSATDLGDEATMTNDLDDRDVITAMHVVRAARWRIEAYSSERGEWSTVYDGPDFRTAIHAVQDHDQTRASYLYGAWREIE